jgi:hypothetical protein
MSFERARELAKGYDTDDRTLAVCLSLWPETPQHPVDIRHGSFFAQVMAFMLELHDLRERSTGKKEDGE